MSIYSVRLLSTCASGATAALRPLQQCLGEERAMASFVEEHLRPTGMRYLQSEGRRASH